MRLNIESADPGELDEVFSALAHPDRRELVRQLARRGEATVGELAGEFDVSLNQVSKHLKTLEAAGLLRRRRVGREHRCSLNAVPLARARSWLDRYEEFWRSALENLERHLDATAKGEDDDE